MAAKRNRLLCRLRWALLAASLLVLFTAGVAQGWFSSTQGSAIPAPDQVISGLQASLGRSSDITRALGSLGTAVPNKGVVSSAAPVASTSAVLAGPFAINGHQIVDAGQGGNPVALRGVDIMDWTLPTQPGGMVDAGALSTLKAWGANMVRLGISSDDYLQQCSGEAYDPTYRSELSSAVKELTAAGIFVILDIHGSNPNCLFSGPQASTVVALPGPDVTATVASLAATYGSNSMVGFEPFNEPQGCALATSGPGASIFSPSSAESTGTCSTEQSAALAWGNPGTVTVQGVNVLGAYILGKSYQSPGMNGLYQTIMNNVPAGAPPPLVFLDANYFASDPSTFDNLGAPLMTASNIVEVFHPYDCQDGSVGSLVSNAVCRDMTPEFCSTTNQYVEHDLIDPSTGAQATRPVVFDEINFPAGEEAYWGHVNGSEVPIVVYQQGYWVNNMIAAMQAGGAAGWGIFYFQIADVNQGVTAYSMLQPGITAATPTPWPVNSNDAPAVAAMGGKQLSCEDPPLGFG